jgi:hypothetical protein
MLGLSLGKLLVLAIIVLVVWYGFKYVHRVEAVRRAVLREMDARRGRARPARSATLAAEDLVKCEACGAYVAARGTTPCSRADCPWGR